MLLELNCPPAPQELCSICHRVMLLENSIDLDVSYVWRWARLSIYLVFSFVKWSGWVRCSLRSLPAPKCYNRVILKCFHCLWTWVSNASLAAPSLLSRLCSEEEVHRVICSSSVVFTVFRIVLEEQPFQKGHFKIYNIFSSKLVEQKRRKCKERNWA